MTPIYSDTGNIIQGINKYQSISKKQSQVEPSPISPVSNNESLDKYKDTVSISFEAQQRSVLDTADLKMPDFGDPLDKYRYGDINTYENMSFLEKANQALLDKRTGLDREKIEEINEKMEAIINDDSIPDEQKQELLTQLAKEKEEEFKKAADKMTDQAKSEEKREQHENS